MIDQRLVPVSEEEARTLRALHDRLKGERVRKGLTTPGRGEALVAELADRYDVADAPMSDRMMGGDIGGERG